MSGSTDRGSGPPAARVGPEPACRVVMPEDVGPVLVQGPVEVVLPDGRVEVSERPVVALCTCMRSRRYPFCDTSHRRHSRPGIEGSADGAASGNVRERHAQ